MKDRNDTDTTDWVRSKTASRQQRFADKQRALGRKARKFWLTDSEREQVAAFVDNLREKSGPGEH